jgi:hypothetical protein
MNSCLEAVFMIRSLPLAVLYQEKSSGGGGETLWR